MTTPSRRTFAIISHPDAGKTTLTEKLLLEGGAIHLAGEVKARGANRRARSDWMKIEQQRGISVTSSVMTFERPDRDGNIVTFTLLDTPGHEDFSEDTYRTLTAVDSAVMVIDAAKGIEPQTRKLFEVCRLRNVPIITFINKVDREGRDPFALLDEVADALALDVCPMSWPVGMGGTFEGIYDFAKNRLRQPTGPSKEFEGKEVFVEGLRDDALAEHLSAEGLEKLREEAELAVGGYADFDLAAYRELLLLYSVAKEVIDPHSAPPTPVTPLSFLDTHDAGLESTMLAVDLQARHEMQETQPDALRDAAVTVPGASLPSIYGTLDEGLARETELAAIGRAQREAANGIIDFDTTLLATTTPAALEPQDPSQRPTPAPSDWLSFDIDTPAPTAPPDLQLFDPATEAEIAPKPKRRT